MRTDDEKSTEGGYRTGETKEPRLRVVFLPSEELGRLNAEQIYRRIQRMVEGHHVESGSNDAAG